MKVRWYNLFFAMFVITAFWSICFAQGVVSTLGSESLLINDGNAEEELFFLKEFSRTYGGSYYDYAYSVQQTSDGGYIVAGWTSSFGLGYYDIYILKLNQYGSPEWKKTYGGGQDDYAHSVQQTSDGGYIVAGATQSFGSGGMDIWVLKLNSSGVIQWQNVYGGVSDERAYSIQQTSDGGYIVGGYTSSYGAGDADFLLLKIDASGNIQWQRTYGGSTDDKAISIKQTSDGGYIVAGGTNSFGAGGYDFWILKVNISGDVQWQNTYGGGGYDYAYSIQQTSDGGYITAGYTNSFGAGSADFWVIKLDATGSIVWQKTYGGSNEDEAYSIIETYDGSYIRYIVAGRTASFGAGSYDAWVLKLYDQGSIKWQKTYGGNFSDTAHFVSPATDGYIIAGRTSSFGAGGYDFWLSKMDTYGNVGAYCTVITDTNISDSFTNITPSGTSVSANVSSLVLVSTGINGVNSGCISSIQCPSAPAFVKTFGGSNVDIAYSVLQTSDEGYVILGYSESYGAGGSDLWIFRLNKSGVPLWHKVRGGGDQDYGYSIQETSEGGFFVTGYTQSFGAGGADIWVLKLDQNGFEQWQRTYGGSNSEGAYSGQQTSDGGYIIVGSTYSYGAGNSDIIVIKLSSTASIEWQKTYGGSGNDYGYSIQQTTDGGYIVAGVTYTYGAGAGDFWILKLNSSGNVQWQRTYGGSSTDVAKSVQQTTDGGYIVAGYTSSYGAGGFDYWVIKLLSDGSVKWQKTYGGVSADYADSILQTLEGGYIITGRTLSFGAGNDGFWMIKLDQDGTIQWQKTYGGSGYDRAYSAQQTSDGGYIVVGETNSFGAGSTDAWVIKLDINGDVGNSCGIESNTSATVVNTTVSAGATSISPANISVTQQTPTVAWTSPNVLSSSQCSSTPTFAKTYGEADSFDAAFSIQQTTDGGYIVAGSTDSFSAGLADLWILKLDASGNILWQKTYGGTNTDYGESIQQTIDGGYIVAGYTESFGAGYADYWILKLDSSGNVIWQKTYGGTNLDHAYSIQQTTDGGYIVAGYAELANRDFWILKLDNSGNVIWQKHCTYNSDEAYSIQQTTDGGYIVAGLTKFFGPGGNSDMWISKLDASGNLLWQEKYGGTGDDYAESIQQTADGGFIVAGYTASFGAGNWDFWILKLDSSGNVIWQKTYGGTGADQAYSIQQTADGGYIVAGFTESFGLSISNLWVLKLDSSGNIDSSCDFISNTSISPEYTNNQYLDTSISQIISTATPQSTNITPVNSNISVSTQCASCSQPIFEGVQSASDADPCISSGIQITWNTPISWGSGATSGTFDVRRYTTYGCSGSYTTVASGLSPTTTTYIDTSVASGTTYYYQIVAINDCTPSLSSIGSNSCSSAVKNNFDNTPCPNVGNTELVSKSGIYANIIWSTVSCSDLAYYRVYASTSYDAEFPAYWIPICTTTNTNCSDALSSSYVAYKTISVDTCGNASSY